MFAVSVIEIINNTRGGIKGEIWEGGIRLHLKPEKFKTRVTTRGVGSIKKLGRHLFRGELLE